MLDVSVVLPSLLPNEEFDRCIGSIRAALVGRLAFEIVCVVRDLDAFSGLSKPDLHFVREEEPGIYGAMNTGLRKAVGQYVYFIGQDDILLPTAANAIVQGKAQDADLLLADVFWGEDRIFRNKLARGVLVWKNWCHQGVFYNRAKLLDIAGGYPARYKVQADHYINIVFSATPGLKSVKYPGCVAWYSSAGFSTRYLDNDFRAVFPSIVRQYFGFGDYLVVVLRRALLAVFRAVRK